MSALKAFTNALLGRGDAAVTVPVPDGPLLPNERLDAAGVLLSAPELDNLTAAGDRVLFSSGRGLFAFPAGRPDEAAELARFDADISALAAGEGGALAIGLDGLGLILRGGPHDGRRIESLGGRRLVAPTALLWLGADTLIVVSGSRGSPATQWRRDLMELGSSGSVWRLDLAAASESCLADGLAWPCGVAPAADGTLHVTESWRHRILSIPRESAGKPKVVLGNLPAYPGRLAASRGGGYWLTFLSIRNQLVEFILREREYRTRMLNEVEELYWMAPSLRSGASFKEPMQGSQLKRMGILKPWSASRSYGLIARCDAAMQPLESFHSRADGSRHGITSVCESDGAVLVGSKGAGLLLSLDLSVKAASKGAA